MDDFFPDIVGGLILDDVEEDKPDLTKKKNVDSTLLLKINDFPILDNVYISDCFELMGHSASISINFSERFIPNQKLCLKIEIENVKKTFKTRVNVQVYNSKLGFHDEISFLVMTFNAGKVTNGLLITNLKMNEISENNGYLNNGTIEIKLIFSNVAQSVESSYGVYSCAACQPSNSINNYGKYSYNNLDPMVRDSYEETGYVGLKNQGSTCYMNSMLQCLFHIPSFRRLVYEMPMIGNEDPEKSIPLNLQRLFTQMQMSKKTVSTKQLTNSFGWGTNETFVQHDVHEFCRVLIDSIDSKLKPTPLKDQISHLFKGKSKSYIRCPNINYETVRYDEFFDLQMQVSGFNNLYDSFKEYTKVEYLTGENKYNTGEFGLQDAEIGVELLELPIILNIHLNRFGYDMMTDTMKKINDFFEFPDFIDLHEFFAEDVQGSCFNAEYELFGIIVHQGTVDYGHYYAYIRPTTDNQWLLFNDNSVSKVTREKAFNDNFGGKSEYYNMWASGSEKSHSAYMLIYVRKDSITTTYEPILNESLPKHLIDFVENEDNSKGSDTTSYNTVEVSVFVDEDLSYLSILGKSKFDTIDWKSKFVFERSKTYEDLVKEISSFTKIPLNDIIVWKLGYYSELSMMEASSSRISEYFLSVFVESKNMDHINGINSNIVFFKVYYPKLGNPIQYIGHCHMPSSAKINSVIPEIVHKLGLPLDVEFNIYQESTSKNLIPVMMTDSLYSYKTMYAFYILELLPRNEEILLSVPFPSLAGNDYVGVDSSEGIPKFNCNDLLEINTQSMSLVQYFTSINDIINFEIKLIENPNVSIAIMRTPTDTSIIDCMLAISRIMKVDFSIDLDTMLLYKEDFYSKKPKSQSIDLKNKRCIKEAFSMSWGNEVLYVTIHHGISEAQMGQLGSYSIEFSNNGKDIQFEKKMLLSVRSKCKDMIESLVQNNLIQNGQYRFLNIFDHKIVGILNANDTLPYDRVIRIEPEKIISTDKLLIPVSHAALDYWKNYSTFGNPFLLEVSPSENGFDLKSRIFEQIQAKEIDKKRLVFSKNQFVSNTKIDDESIISFKNGDTIFIIHPRNPSKVQDTKGGIKFNN